MCPSVKVEPSDQLPCQQAVLTPGARLTHESPAHQLEQVFVFLRELLELLEGQQPIDRFRSRHTHLLDLTIS